MHKNKDHVYQSRSRIMLADVNAVFDIFYD